MYSEKKVAVVGAGVIGVTTALAVKKAYPRFEVTIFAEDFSPSTTGDGSAGLWGPFLISETPASDILRWGRTTHLWMENFWKIGLSPETGISLLPVIRVSKDTGSHQTPPWMSVVYGAKRLTDEDLRNLSEEHGATYRSGFSFLTYTCEPKYLLPFLMNQFRLLGGVIQRRKIDTFNELAEEGYEIVINCSGLGARELVGDLTVKSIRGQVARVKAPWVFGVILEENGGNYIIPNMECAIVGGTGQENDYDVKVRSLDSKFIREGCTRILPALGETEFISEWVGLRPGRPTVRLESEILSKTSGGKFMVIHNYGHGGSGVTLSWGCAMDVVKILTESTSRKVECCSHL